MEGQMRIRSLALVVAVWLVAAGIGLAVAQAQEATPAAGTELAVVPLAEVQTSDVPDGPVFLGLARFRFPVGAATPGGADPGAVFVVVEEGDFVATLRGPAIVGDEPVTGTPAGERGERVSLGPGDAVFVPAGTPTSFRNKGKAEATLLAVMVFPEDPFGAFAQTQIGDVAVELLAGGMVDSVPSPATITLASATFPPGADLPSSPARGPALGVLRSGDLTYEVTEGDSAVSRAPEGADAGRAPAAAAALDAEVRLSSGDAFLEETGAVSGIRNSGDESAELLVAFLVPAEGAADESAPAAATPTS
jgi:quercetin dioxygenase-like cupin family protein